MIPFVKFGALWSLFFTTALVRAVLPPTPEGLTIVNSTKFPEVSISYKETKICETTPGVKSYSGYVHLPVDAAAGRNFPIHTFFWFFTARNDPQNAPLSLWLQGGPGAPSVAAALGENGPCRIGEDSKTTLLNPWSWNNNVNMLYVDQPVQVGFSYDKLVNGVIDEIKSPFVVQPADVTKVVENATLFTGTFYSRDNTTSANTTAQAAAFMWDFMQTWIQEFPEFKSKDNKLSIWAESYGGHYGPTFADFFLKKNDQIDAGTISAPAVKLNLESLGLMNACIDMDTQMPLYPEFAFNNTYGIQAMNETVYNFSKSNLPKCQNMTATCRALGDKLDPNGTGANAQVNKACNEAFSFCFLNVHDAYWLSGRYHFDITAPLTNAFPPKFAAGYLNTREIQQALGVPLNFTGNSAPVSKIFEATGDFVRGHNLAILGQLLDRGIRLAMVYGDRDYQCNWLGGEKVSLAINSSASANFRKAGYANIETNASYVGGVVRQHGNLSFSRVFQAGHEVPWYQPETAFRIFNRVMTGRDVATGQKLTAGYSSSGPADVFSIKSTIPPPETVCCYIWDVMETCTKTQAAILTNGSAIVSDFILRGYRLPNGTEIMYNECGGKHESVQGSSSNTSSLPGRSNAAGDLLVAGAMRTSLTAVAALATLQAVWI